MRYSVTEQGISALKSMSQKVIAAEEDICSGVASVLVVSDSMANTLGPHKASLDSALENISNLINGTKQNVTEISNKLNMTAQAYEEFLQTDRIKDTVQSANGMAGIGGLGALIGGIFGHSGGEGKAAAGNGPSSGSAAEMAAGNSSQTFSDFQIAEDPYSEGTMNFPGSHYQEYLDIENNMDQYTFSTEGYDNVVEDISPDQIEGVTVSNVETADKFWGQHETGGTEDSFLGIASHIPDVKGELEKGKSIDDIKEDPVLGSCAQQYFSPLSSEQVRVVKCGDFYLFDGNGRHRILAAKHFGYSFPIHVTGKFIHK